MKMSNEFDLPLQAEDGAIYQEDSEYYIGIFESHDFDKAAVHAINYHDKLVEALNKTNEELKKCGGVYTERVYEILKRNNALLKELEGE